MAIALAFASIASRDLLRGLKWYAVLGVSPLFAVGAFSGNEMVTGIPLAEVLATVLVVLWVLQIGRAPLGRLLPFERWLVALLPAALVSLASGMAWLDTNVPRQNVKLAVSVGQILLFAWPMGVYFVASRVVRTREWCDEFSRLMLYLALPQFAMLLAPDLRPYLIWSQYFGLIAAPLALSRATHESGWLMRIGLALYLVPPFVDGLITGKTFLYGYILISSLTIAWIRLRRLFWFALPVIGFVAVLIALIPEGTELPGPLQKLVETEEEQQSWGGRTGRGQLIVDAVNIWSNFPLLGVGPANSYPYMLTYSAIGTPHSQYADLLLECGVVGLSIFVLFVLGVLRYGLKGLDEPHDEPTQIFIIGWLSSFVAMSLLSITGDYMLHSIRNGGIELFTGFYLHWVFLGAAMGRLRQDATAPAAAPAAALRPWSAESALGRPTLWLPRR